MDLNTLREIWKKNGAYATETASTLWNNRADNFGKKKLPSFEDNHFLQLIKRRVELTPEITSLDIGCGTGIYSMALASQIGTAVGCDVADRMIDIAEKSAQTNNVSNVKFLCVDWQTADINVLAYKKNFDIVFAHMTPAVNDFITLDKMVACANKHCFMRKPTRRTDRVRDPVLALLGLSRRNNGSDDSMEYIFSYLWNMGFEPRYHYQSGIMGSEQTVQEAMDWCIGWAKMQRELTKTDEAAALEYLESIAVDGVVSEHIETTYVTIDWAI